MENVKTRLQAAFYWHSEQAANACAKAEDRRASRFTKADAEKAATLHQHHAQTLAYVIQNGYQASK